MNESKKRDRLSPGYIKKLLGPMPEEMRAKHRAFLQVSGRRFHDPKKQGVAKTQPSSFGFYRLRKLYTKLKKRGWANPELQDPRIRRYCALVRSQRQNPTQIVPCTSRECPSSIPKLSLLPKSTFSFVPRCSVVGCLPSR